jgi:hypothetical protein
MVKLLFVNPMRFEFTNLLVASENIANHMTLETAGSSRVKCGSVLVSVSDY